MRLPRRYETTCRIPGPATDAAERQPAHVEETGKDVTDPWEPTWKKADLNTGRGQLANQDVGAVEQQLRDLAVKQERDRYEEANALLAAPELDDALEMPLDDPIIGVKLAPNSFH